MYNFQEPAELLLSAGAAWPVKDKTELSTRLKSLLADTHLLTQAGQRAQKIIGPHQGATQRNLAIIKKFIS